MSPIALILDKNSLRYEQKYKWVINYLPPCTKNHPIFKNKKNTTLTMWRVYYCALLTRIFLLNYYYFFLLDEELVNVENLLKENLVNFTDSYYVFKNFLSLFSHLYIPLAARIFTLLDKSKIGIIDTCQVNKT
jgi:hypothetical protein